MGAAGGPLAPITVPLGAVAGGVAAAFGASAAQDALIDATVDDKANFLGGAFNPDTIRRDVQTNPKSTLAGEVAPAIVAFNPVRGVQGAARALGTAKNLATSGGRQALRELPKHAQQAELANLRNVAIGAGAEVGVEGAQQAITGEFDPLRLAVAGAAGSTLNEPNRLGRKIGLRGTVDTQPDPVVDQGALRPDVQPDPIASPENRRNIARRATVDLGEAAPDPRQRLDALNAEDAIALPDPATAVAEQGEAQRRIDIDRRQRAEVTLEELADAGGTSRTREQIIEAQQEARRRIEEQQPRDQLRRKVDSLSDEQRTRALEKAQRNIEQDIADAEAAAKPEADRLARVDDDVDALAVDDGVVPEVIDASGNVRSEANQPGKPTTEQVVERTRAQIRKLTKPELRQELRVGDDDPRSRSQLATDLIAKTFGRRADAPATGDSTPDVAASPDIQLNSGVPMPEALAAVDRAIVSGARFAAPHIETAARWLASKGSIAVQSITAATRALVKRFGEGIRRHVPRIYRFFRDRVLRDEQGAFAATSVPGAKTAEKIGERVGDAVSAIRKKFTPASKPPSNTPTPPTKDPGGKVAMTSAAKMAAEGLVGKVGEGLAYHSEPIVDFIARKGGDKAGRVAELGRQAVDESKNVFGKLAVDAKYDQAQDVIRKDTPGAKWLNEFNEDGVSNLRLALEGNADAPAFARKEFEAVDRFNREIGKLTEGEGLLGKATGRMQRMPTSFLFDIIKQGQGTAYDATVDAFHKVNPHATREEIAGVFESIKSGIDGSDFQSVVRAINQEKKRAWKQVPSIIELPGITGKRKHWLFHDRSFDYMRTAAERTSHRVGFLRAFGSDDAAKAIMAEAKKGMASGDAQAVSDLYRALHGLPVDMGRFGATSNLLRSINRALSDIFSPVALSGSSLVNAIELAVGQTPRVLGYDDYFKAMKLLAGGDRKQMKLMLEELGAINRAIFDWSSDPASPLRTLSRKFRNSVTIASGNNHLNELQELLAATTAHVKASRMAAGKVNGKEADAVAMMLQDMGFDGDLARKMVDGGGEQADYDRFIRQSAAYLTGGNKSPGESSRFANNRLASSLIRFQTYPMVASNLIAKPMMRALHGKTKVERAAGYRGLAKQMGFTATSGIGILALRAALTGGEDGLEILASEAKDEPVEFTMDALLQGVGGPASVAYWAISRGSEDGDVADSAVRSTFPGGVALELSDALGSFGSYKNRSMGERAGMYLERTPAGRILSSVMGSVAFGRPTAGDRAAIRGYWRWARDSGQTRISATGGSDKDKAFRANMRRAADSILAGRDPSAHLREAMGLKGGDKNASRSIRQSLLARRLIGKLKQDERESLRKRIGQSAYGRLLAHDERLEKWAEALR